MKAEFKDFIGVFDNGIDAGLCDVTVNKFEEFQSLGLTREGVTGRGLDHSVKNSLDVDFMQMNLQHVYDLKEEWIRQLDACYALYREEYPQFQNFISAHAITCLQVQKYPSGRKSGYFSFHCEAGSKDSSDRVMTYLVYLNDVSVGGETELLEQKLRVQPKKGTVVFFPTGATHVHRGNPVLSDEDKYILTGWYNYV